MKISVVIPNYNGRLLLENNLGQVFKRADVDEVIVVDDASTDDSVSYIKANFPKVKLIEIVVNKGFSTAVNLGVKAAGGDLIALLNTDAIPEKDFLQFALPHFSDPGLFAVGCLDRSIEGQNSVERGRGVGRFHRGFLMHERGDTDKANTLWVSGGSGIFRKVIWEQLEGMDEMYNPFYWEDIDLSYRAQKVGYKVMFEAKSIVVHRHGEGAIKIHHSKETIHSIAYRNQFLFVWKNISDNSFLVEHLIWLPFHLGTMFVKGEWPFFKGFGQALLHLPEIINQRLSRQNRIIRTDREILALFS